MQRHIFNSCLGAYLPAGKYAKCSAFGLNMKSGQIHWNILDEYTGIHNWSKYFKYFKRMLKDMHALFSPHLMLPA